MSAELICRSPCLGRRSDCRSTSTAFDAGNRFAAARDGGLYRVGVYRGGVICAGPSNEHAEEIFYLIVCTPAALPELDVGLAGFGSSLILSIQRPVFNRSTRDRDRDATVDRMGGAEGTRTPDPHTASGTTVLPRRAGRCPYVQGPGKTNIIACRVVVAGDAVSDQSGSPTLALSLALTVKCSQCCWVYEPRARCRAFSIQRHDSPSGAAARSLAAGGGRGLL